MGEWKLMDEYPDKGRRDDAGKWHDEPGPVVDLKMPDGTIIREAQWRGEKLANGGEGWAFWFAGDRLSIGYHDPEFFRFAESQISGMRCD